MVGSYCKRRLAVAGDRVDAGARCPLETEVYLWRDRVQVYQVPEVEGPQECAMAIIIGAWGPPVRWPGRRVGVGHYHNGRRVHHAGDLAPHVRPPSQVWGAPHYVARKGHAFLKRQRR